MLAWADLATTVRPAVLSALRGLPGGHRLGDEEDWVFRTLDRFWRAVPAERFGEFADSRALVRYVKLCASSVYLDAMRDQRRHATIALDGAVNVLLDRADVEQDLLDEAAAHDLWAAVCSLLKDDDERRIAYLSFVRGMSPREIRATDPSRFQSIGYVYQTKRRILDRVRAHMAEE
jgi:DNA-directed RNA polymerase specialized sigma24 family protein